MKLKNQLLALMCVGLFAGCTEKQRLEISGVDTDAKYRIILVSDGKGVAMWDGTNVVHRNGVLSFRSTAGKDVQIVGHYVIEKLEEKK